MAIEPVLAFRKLLIADGNAHIVQRGLNGDLRLRRADGHLRGIIEPLRVEFRQQIRLRRAAGDAKGVQRREKARGDFIVLKNLRAVPFRAGGENQRVLARIRAVAGGKAAQIQRFAALQAADSLA